MKIGIDCRQFYDVHLNIGAGVERYVYHLTKTILEMDKNNDYVLFFYSDLSPETIHKVKGNNSRVKVIKLFRTVSKIPLLDNHIRFSRTLKNEKLDKIIFPANVMPLFYRGDSILVIHDLAIYPHPEWFPEKQWFSTRIIVPRSIKKTKRIVAISESTKKDLMDIFKVPEKKIEMIYPGVVVRDGYLDNEIGRVMNKFYIKGEYILFIGTIEPRKNIYNLIQAFSNYLFDNEDSKLSLVLAGIRGWKYSPVFKLLNEMNKRMPASQIKYVGKVSNRERNILIKNCSAFVFPSKYEGFGFPVLEAMSLGVPVITSNNSSLGEIAGEGAQFVDSDDINELRRAIQLVVNDKYLRHQLITKGKERARLFTWEKCAEKMLDAIRAV